MPFLFGTLGSDNRWIDSLPLGLKLLMFTTHTTMLARLPDHFNQCYTTAEELGALHRYGSSSSCYHTGVRESASDMTQLLIREKFCVYLTGQVLHNKY